MHWPLGPVIGTAMADKSLETHGDESRPRSDNFDFADQSLKLRGLPLRESAGSDLVLDNAVLSKSQRERRKRILH